jgi:hypothetical protein
LLSTNRNVPRNSGTDTEAWLGALRGRQAYGDEYSGKGLPNRVLSFWNWASAHAAINVIITVEEVTTPWFNAKKLVADSKQIAQGMGVCQFPLLFNKSIERFQWYFMFIALGAKSFDRLAGALSENAQRQVLLLLSLAFRKSMEGSESVKFGAEERASYLEKAASTIDQWVNTEEATKKVFYEIHSAELPKELRRMKKAKEFPPYCGAFSRHMKEVCIALAPASSLVSMREL